MARKKKRLRFWIIVLVIVFPPLFLASTGLHHVPVDVSLGPCLMDYTSPQTYMGKRPSPLQEVRFSAGEGEVLVCYGSPAARGRKVFGGIVRYNSLWRFGANEPTRLYTNSDIKLGNLEVPKGRYSLYALVNEKEWELFVSTSTYHWGNWIDQSVRDQEVGSIKIPVDSISTYVEAFTIETIDDSTGTKNLAISWENSRLLVPVTN